MLRVLAIQARQLAFEKNRRAGCFLQSNQQPSCSTVRNHGLSGVGVRSLFRRMFSHYKHRHGRNGSFGVCKVKERGYRSFYTKNFYTAYVNASSMNHHAQLAWKRLNLLCSYIGPTFAPLSRIACAVSLSFTRFHVVPGILAYSIGELAWAQGARADGEYSLTTGNGLYVRVKDYHVSFSFVVHSILEGVMLVLRAAYLTILFTPAIMMAPLADWFGVEVRRKWLHLVLHTLERAGPAFIKWGQWAATRPDLFPNDLCMELAKLHTKAPPHSFAYSRTSVEKAFGRKLSEIFENFEEEPIASGSIAQVHRASLRYRYPGQRLRRPIEVAVKVRHPGVGESIRRDFVLINLVAKISKFIPALNWLRLDESVQQFAVFMMSQVDLAREAAHLSRFIYNFRRWKDVSFPKPLYPLVHPAVLVETFEKGESVSCYIDELGHTRIKRDIAHIGTHALLKMLLVDNFVHADMHPGNILVRVPQSKLSRKNLFRSKPQIIFLDVGMTAELCKNDRINLLEFFKAVAVRDGRTAAECTLRLSKRQNCPNPHGFIEELERMFAYWGTPEGEIFHPVECMHQLLEQVRRYKVNVDGNVCTVLVTILVLESDLGQNSMLLSAGTWLAVAEYVLHNEDTTDHHVEGWQRKLDPNFDIMQTLKTLLLNQDWAQPIDYFFS